MDNRAIVTVIGKDRIGIIARITAILADCQINVLDISQTIMQEFFTMMMLVDVSQCRVPLDEVRERLNVCGEEMGLDVRMQQEGIFKAMHRI
jgi:ACT domain-containing protein